MYSFLLVFESIGTAELILIGIVALIFLGPRKLPQIAKTIGKTMADFRKTTNEFKTTWEREVNFDEEAKALRTGDLEKPAAIENSVSATSEILKPAIRPDVRPPSEERVKILAEKAKQSDIGDTEKAPPSASTKKDWI